MGKVTFSAFGRGSLAAYADLNTPYATLRTLSGNGSTGLLDEHNFHERAGFPERVILWNTTSGHDHAYVPLGMDSVSFPQLKMGRGDADGTALAYSFTPKSLCLFGVAMDRASFTAQGIASGTVDFAMTSIQRSAFLPGTIPFIKAGLFTNDSAMTCKFSLVITDVTSQGFSWVISSSATTSGNYLGISYVAFGVAPGLVTRIG